MDSTTTEYFSPAYSKYIEYDLLIRKIVLTHDPDGRRFDSHLLLDAIESVMCSTASPEVITDHSPLLSLFPSFCEFKSDLMFVYRY